MAFWPDVNRGDKVEHHALLENNLRHLVNALNGFSAGAAARTAGGEVRINIWNATGENLDPGTPVAFDSQKDMCGDALPAKMVQDVNQPWGVCSDYLAVNEIGPCIVAGPAVVTLYNGSAADYAEPSGTVFGPAAGGAARILFKKNSKAVILLGGGASEAYDGPFALSYDSETQKVKVAPGYICCNGEFRSVDAAELDPQRGIVCVHSQLGNDGHWSKPEIRFGWPDSLDYPIGHVAVEVRSGGDRSVTVSSYRVAVAILMATQTCPFDAYIPRDI